MMYYLLVIFSIFISACAQMLLKQGARKEYSAWWRQYVNGWVIGGYAILFSSLVLNIFCLGHGVHVKEISTMESLSYLFVPCLAFILFKEGMTWRKAGAIIIIISGVVIFFL